MGRLTFRVALCVVVTAWLGGCGGSSKGDGDSGSCDNAEPCGGNIVGSWNITSSCLDIDGAAMMGTAECPGQTTRVLDVGLTGNLVFNANGSYSGMVTQTGSVITTLPASCLMRQGITVTCAQLTDALQANVASGGFSSANCSPSAANGCACTLVLRPTSSEATGTYTTTADGVLTQTVTGGAPDSSDYCVKGSTLTLSPHEDGSMVGMPSTSGSVTFTKQ